jgi:hypothetical protein
MAEKVDGTDNVYVLGVKADNQIIPARTQEQVDDMLTESLAIQLTQVSDFVADLVRLGDRPDIINYGSLMKHLQQECVFHLSALAAAAIIRVRELESEK